MIAVLFVDDEPEFLEMTRIFLWQDEGINGYGRNTGFGLFLASEIPRSMSFPNGRQARREGDCGVETLVPHGSFRFTGGSDVPTHGFFSDFSLGGKK